MNPTEQAFSIVVGIQKYLAPQITLTAQQEADLQKLLEFELEQAIHVKHDPDVHTVALMAAQIKASWRVGCPNIILPNDAEVADEALGIFNAVNELMHPEGKK